MCGVYACAGYMCEHTVVVVVVVVVAVVAAAAAAARTYHTMLLTMYTSKLK